MTKAIAAPALPAAEPAPEQAPPSEADRDELDEAHRRRLHEALERAARANRAHQARLRHGHATATLRSFSDDLTTGSEGYLDMRVSVMIAGFTVASSGCGGADSSEVASFPTTASIQRGEGHSGKEAYLYARLMTNSSYLSMAFVIQCKDGNTYTIPFSYDISIQMFRISPSICSLREIFYLVDGRAVSYKSVNPVVIGGYEPNIKDSVDVGTLLWNVEFGPGKAYYLGDILIDASSSGWKVERATDNYVRSTNEMRLTYPHFADIPTEKKLLGKAPSSASEVEKERRRKACGSEFGDCRASCAKTDGGPTCLKQCLKKQDECRSSVPN
ncbi:MAG TPA: hypothetical protein VE093_44780 [Polyangiaceae bacterium]|jgi:hypothetical protein|nr:hypothetical protein [Polyangiaceae bacterium]